MYHNMYDKFEQIKSSSIYDNFDPTIIPLTKFLFVKKKKKWFRPTVPKIMHPRMRGAWMCDVRLRDHAGVMRDGSVLHTSLCAIWTAMVWS